MIGESDSRPLVSIFRSTEPHVDFYRFMGLVMTEDNAKAIAPGANGASLNSGDSEHLAARRRRLPCYGAEREPA